MGGGRTLVVLILLTLAGAWLAGCGGGGPYRVIECAAGSCSEVTFRSKPAGWEALPDCVRRVEPPPEPGKLTRPPETPAGPVPPASYTSCRP